MTGRTVLDDPFTNPVGYSLPVGSTHPIFALSEMALGAHLIAVIHIDFHTRFGYEKITLILIMTRKTGKGL